MIDRQHGNQTRNVLKAVEYKTPLGHSLLGDKMGEIVTQKKCFF